MNATMEFLNECTDAELYWLTEELFDIYQAFYNGNGGENFMDFLNRLASDRPRANISGELKLVIESLKGNILEDIL